MSVGISLKPDPVIPGQKYFCVSFVSPEGIKNCSQRNFKIRGSFATIEEAKERCLELRDIDKYTNTLVGVVGEWMRWDPDPNSPHAGDSVYADKEQQELMQAYNENRQKAKRAEQQRINDNKRKAANQKKKIENRTRKLTRELPKKVKKQLQQEMKERSGIEEEEGEVDTNKIENIIKEEEKRIVDLGDKLKRIKELYNKSIKKE